MLEREKIVPHLRQRKKLNLFPAKGRVISVADFAKQNVSTLTHFETEIVGIMLQKLSVTTPNIFKYPLVSSKDMAIEGKAIESQAVGSRSAYLTKQKLKLKGCRPTKNLYFPNERLDFGEKKMTLEKIRFGSLSAENVMREILAFCFFKQNKLPTLHIPVCVFEYNLEEEFTYCLVYQTPTEQRLESKENSYGLTIFDFILARGLEKKFKIKVLPNEIQFNDIDMGWYSKEKGNLLAKMNMSGGFRGILNSNLGNDLVYQNKFYICDFDTFKVIEIPQNPSEEFISSFVLWCVTEILKTSPFVLNYIDIDKLSKKKTIQVLWNSYSNNSSLWHRYWSDLLQLAEKKGWSISVINKTLNKILSYDVIYDLILDNVLNSSVLESTYRPEMSFYIPHNY